jgi:pyruvate, water dikinase
VADFSQNIDSGRYVRMLHEVDLRDVGLVGGKNASLGDMIQGLSAAGINIPGGFATTVAAYDAFLDENGMKEAIESWMNQYREGTLSLTDAGTAIRERFASGRFPKSVAEAIGEAYGALCREREADALSVAVRSSATAEDLPEAGFAGMLESFLNVSGEVELLDACRHCFSSLFTDRAIRYREEMGLGHLEVALSVGVLPMVRSDKGCAGVMFSIEKDTGFPDLVVITAAWGLGESVVQGAVIPDEYSVYKMLQDTPGADPILDKYIGAKHKKCIYAEGGGTQYIPTAEEERLRQVLGDADILTLAQWAVAIEAHYGRPMDIEWAKDGESGTLFIVQARPVTTAYRRDAALSFCTMKEKGNPLLTGISIGEGIATGDVCLIRSFQDIDQIVASSIIVSEDANTAWVSDLKEKKIKGVVTNYGGRNSHAAIICRELGIPSVVGTGHATKRLEPGQKITVHAIEGDYGYVYQGTVSCVADQVHLGDIPHTRMKVMINVASAAAAFQWWRLPCAGIGLVRMDYILQHVIKIHPMALARYDALTEKSVRYQIEALTGAYSDKKEYFVDRLSACLAKIAASRLPDPVIVRPSNLEPAEYAELTGGRPFEEAAMDVDPGLRGVRRYVSPQYREAFEMECEALRRVREQHGLTNIHLMMPHCETVSEADAIFGMMEALGLKRGEKDLSVYLCCDFRANVTHAHDFMNRFDGLSLDMRKFSGWVRSKEPLVPGTSPENSDPETAMRKALEAMRDASRGRDRGLMVRDRMFVNDASLIYLLVDVGVDALSIDPESVPRIMGWIAEAEREENGRSQ